MDRELGEARLVAFSTILYGATLAATLATVALYLFFEGVLLMLGVSTEGGNHGVRVVVAASLFDLIVVFGGLIVWTMALKYDFSLGSLVLVKSTVAAIGVLAIPAWFVVQQFPEIEITFIFLSGALVGSMNLLMSLIAQSNVESRTLWRGGVSAGLFALATGGGGLFAGAAMARAGGVEVGAGAFLLIGANLLLMLGSAASALHAFTVWRDVWKPLNDEIAETLAQERALREPAWA